MAFVYASSSQQRMHPFGCSATRKTANAESRALNVELVGAIGKHLEIWGFLSVMIGDDPLPPERLRESVACKKLSALLTETES